MGERWYEEGQTVATEWEAVALDFVKRLMRRDFRGARELLGERLHSALTEADLEKRALKLISEEQVPMSTPWVLSSLDAWPGKHPPEVGQVHVCVGGDYNEAITPTVISEKGRLRMGEIVWRRP